MQSNILIVGGGMTGAVISAIIKSNSLLPSLHVKDIGPVHIWDKSRGIGGRMSTSRCDRNSRCIADLGAQYITISDKSSVALHEFHNSLISNDVIKPMECGMIGARHNTLQRNFVCPLGINSVVKHFMSLSDVSPKLEACVIGLHKEDKSWKVTCSNGYVGLFEKVILTMPVPQVLALQGDIQASLDPFRSNLSKVCYSSRYVLILYYDSSDCGYDWGVQYVDNHPIFRYVSVENVKRGKLTEPASVVFHTTTEFGTQNVDCEKSDVEVKLLQHTRELLPHLPEPDRVRCHKWRYSQVASNYPGSPGCLVLQKDPFLMIAGDAFTKSNVDGCIESAIKSVEALKA